jgi:hypothetical protein
MKASPELMRVLDTGRYPGMSGKMRGIVRCILGCKDGFAELCITADGFLMGRLSNDCGFNEFLGDQGDLNRNWSDLLDATAAAESDQLTADLRREADQLFQANIVRH